MKKFTLTSKKKKEGKERRECDFCSDTFDLDDLDMDDGMFLCRKCEKKYKD